MRSLEELRGASRLKGLLFDIDDTLTTGGRLGPEAYAAMARLKAAGRLVVPVTGRPAGWCDHIARMWPVDAVVGENGAFYFLQRDGRLLKQYQDDEGARARNRERLKEIGKRVLEQVPGCALASDQAYRETDLAIDWCEDVKLEMKEAVAIRELMEREGLSAKISSIHVNGWFGTYDKLFTARRLFAEQFGTDLAAANADYAFAGDSPNDAPMFAFFQNSVGVANVRRFEGQLQAAPKYVTRGESGAGFAELVARLLDGG
jgi:hypothetical protein